MRVERYRSGHNGPDSKSGIQQCIVGSNPTLSAKGKGRHKIVSAFTFGGKSKNGNSLCLSLEYLLRKRKYPAEANSLCEGNGSIPLFSLKKIITAFFTFILNLLYFILPFRLGFRLFLTAPRIGALVYVKHPPQYHLI